MKTNEHTWIEIRSCTWLHDFIKSVLESDGIQALIPDEHTLGVQPLYGAALGGGRVMVRAEDVDRAEECLNAIAGEPETET